jgi:ABC-type bacteriocin/lantibiotic exporter with double-glycine peptidase domain
MDQQLNLGQFIAAEIVILTVLAAVEKLILSLDKGYDLLTSLDKLTKVTEKEIESGGSLDFNSNGMGIALQFENLSFSFDGDKQVLNNINLEVLPAQKICIMGEASSGKSTLLELATGIYQHQEGALLINNIPIGNYLPESYRKNIGVFYHDQDVFLGTLLENVTMGDPGITVQQLLPLVDVLGLKSYLHTLPAGFDTMLKPTGKGLSSIIAKKILLLRAFAGSPDLLILDEPFEMAGGLHCLNIADYLIGLADTTVLVASGDIAFAEKCDIVVIMENGKIKKSGPAKLILQQEGKI